MSERILFVDDDVSMAELAAAALPKWGFQVDICHAGAEAIERCRAEEYQAVVTDLKMRGMDGIELCSRLVENRADIPVLVITAFGDLDTAIQALRAGAYDFLTKPLEMAELAMALERAVEHRRLEREVRRLRREVGGASPDGMIGRSAAMRKLFQLLDRLEDSEGTVSIRGETGTGKELVARELHRRSPRTRGPFVPLNCAAVPKDLLESELFGHAKGAFSGAHKARIGLVREAAGGTLFLDEVGELPLELQPKLLRVLQERKVRPVGGTEEVSVDIRVLSASNRDLQAEVAAGRFREDLLFRLDVIHIEVPPLRERENDVLLLAQHFLEVYAAEYKRPVHGITAESARRLLEYPWPGNVRELMNVVERAVALTEHEELVVEDLPEKLRSGARAAAPPKVDSGEGELLPMAEVEKRHILRVLDAVDGRRKEAADILGLDRKTLYRKLRGYEEE